MVKELRLVSPYVRKHRGDFVQGVLTVIFASVCSAIVPFLIKFAVDALRVAPGQSILPLVGLTACLVALQAALRYRSRMKILNGAREIEYELRKDFFDHLVSLPYSFFRDHHRGDVIARMMNDMGNVRMMIGIGMLQFSGTVVITLLSLAMMFRLSSLVTLLAILPLVFLFLFMKRFMGRLHAVYTDVQECYGRISKGVDQVLSGVRVIKNYVLHDEEGRRFREVSREYMEKNLASTRISGLLFPAIGLLGGLGTLLVMWAGGYLLMEKEITLGDFIALNTYYVMLMWPIAALGWIMNLYQRGVVSVKRIEEIMQIPAEAKGIVPSGALDGPVRLEGVSVVKEGRSILDSIDLTLGPREKLLLIGPTGSGKSTLLNLILGFEPGYEGRVTVNGVEGRELDPLWRRQNITIVPQDSFLYSLSIRDNTFSGEGAERFLEAVHMRLETERFERGVDTLVGEKGITLSGGQKQRITVARALSTDARLFLFDDPFAHVDGLTESVIWERLWPLIKEKAMVIVSSRPVPLRYLTRVIVMVDGRVVDEGAPLDLVETSPYMRLMYEVKATA